MFKSYPNISAENIRGAVRFALKENMHDDGLGSKIVYPDMLRRVESSRLFAINSDASFRLIELIADPEFMEQVSFNTKFAIPPFDNMRIVFEVDDADLRRYHNEEPRETDRSKLWFCDIKRTGDKVEFCAIMRAYPTNKESVKLSFPVDGKGKGEGEWTYVMQSVIMKYTIGDEEHYKDAWLPSVEEGQTSDDMRKLYAADYEKTESLLVMCLVLFLFIHKRPEYVMTIPASHKMVGNKRVAYGAHKTVDLKLFEKKEVITRLAPPTGSHASPRAHEVIGHWVHYGFNRQCNHEWERETLNEDDPRRQFRENGSEIIRHVCKHCGAKRTFRDHFIRGDASKGWIRHDYVA